MTVFFTADTHFGQARTLKLSRRPFTTVAKMDACMVQKWNAAVSAADTVYHLGDFGNPEMAKALAGKILFLPGNYDTAEITGILARTCKIIQPNTVLKLSGFQFTLVHAPCTATGSGFFLFGHIHKLQMVKRNGLNVGVDCHHFCPLTLKGVLFYVGGIKHHYNQDVFVQTLGVKDI